MDEDALAISKPMKCSLVKAELSCCSNVDDKLASTYEPSVIATSAGKHDVEETVTKHRP